MIALNADVLPAPLGSDQGEDFALPHLQGQVINGGQSAETDGQPVDREQYRGRHGAAFAISAALQRRRRHRCCMAGTMPSGRKYTTSTINTP